jgi:hypothetical protein
MRTLPTVSICGKLGIRRCMTRGRSTVMGFGFGAITGFGCDGLPEVRHGAAPDRPVNSPDLSSPSRRAAQAVCRRELP